MPQLLQAPPSLVHVSLPRDIPVAQQCAPFQCVHVLTLREGGGSVFQSRNTATHSIVQHRRLIFFPIPDYV
jgi:hypothetical protein